MRERRLCLASCNLAGLTGRHHPQPYRSWPLAVHRLHLLYRRLILLLLLLPPPLPPINPHRLFFPSDAPSTYQIHRDVTAASPHALKPSVLTGFFSLPDEDQVEYVG